MRRPFLPLLVLFLAAPIVHAESWGQWAHDAAHHGNVGAGAQQLATIIDEQEIEPFLEQQLETSGTLLVHYPAPLVDGPDVFLETKRGTYTGPQTRQTQIWGVRAMRWSAAHLVERWVTMTGWTPVPFGSAQWEAVFHPALTSDFVYAPDANGGIAKLRRADGARLATLAPFPHAAQPVYVASPPVVDAAGNVFYTAIELDELQPWTSDAINAWLVRISPDDSISTVPFSQFTTSAPAARDACLGTFTNAQLPWPPSPKAVPPSVPCGSQRPGINAAPAVAPDGTIYVVSRAHFNSRWAYLNAINPDLTPRWSSTLRDRLHDGCNVLLPTNGAPGGCRAGAITGVDPADNTAGPGTVIDDSTSSPVVTPDGSIVYGAYTRFNYAQGHLMKFNTDGSFVAAYPFGWDITPAIDTSAPGAYSIVLKENRYAAGSYCSVPQYCPANRYANATTPDAYFVTKLDASLQPIWHFANTNTRSCYRDFNGSLLCTTDHPDGFEWCVNAPAVDNKGVIVLNSEDGWLYAINPNGTMRDRIFLSQPLGAAYTPIALGSDGRIYAQNAGQLFVIGSRDSQRARAVSH
jgi:outer membrane protein assembly factor BamB